MNIRQLHALLQIRIEDGQGDLIVRVLDEHGRWKPCRLATEHFDGRAKKERRRHLHLEGWE